MGILKLKKHDNLATIFGVSGNIVSALVFLVPLRTFWIIIRRRTAAGFQSFPYVVALMSAMLLLYYGILKAETFIVIINAAGCSFEAFYLSLYMIYAPREDKMVTVKLISVLNVGCFSMIAVLTRPPLKGTNLVNGVGWVCAIFSVCVFASPLSIMRKVIKTKSVEFMPFWLSFFLTLSAVLWFLYGLFVADLFIAGPNVMGFLLGLAQMILYFKYKDWKKDDTTQKCGANPNQFTQELANEEGLKSDQLGV